MWLNITFNHKNIVTNKQLVTNLLWLKLLATGVLVIGKFLVTPWIKTMLWLKMTFNHIKYCGWKCQKYCD